MPSSLFHFRPSGRRFAMALAVLAGVLALALLAGDRSSAQTSAELEDVRAEQDDVRDRLAEQNAAIDALIGEVSALRVQEDKVAAELAEQEEKLAAERAELADARAFLVATRRKLDRSLVELEDLLVSIYRYGQPDMATVLLESDGIDQLSRTKTYLDSIRDYETGVVVRVRDLRAAAADAVTEIEATVERMEAARQAIAERQQELAASRAELESREAALQAAQDERREQLSELQGDERDLVRALSTPDPAPAPAADGSSPAPESAPAPPPPADASGVPEAVQSAIAAADSISDTPYLWGGGHGSFESAGYDCSGAVSYALHGGGFLSTPLDSTGFMTWGEPGPGKWITVYSNPGHAYIVINGRRFDTSGGAGPRWQGPRDPAGFVATHPPGY
jgi:hypothetical protein